MKRMRKVCMFLLCLCFVAGMAVHVCATETEEVLFQETVGTVTLTIYDDGYAVFEGSGSLEQDWNFLSMLRDYNVTKVKIGDGITEIGNSAFAGCTFLSDVDISGSVTNIGIFAFNACSSLTSVKLNEGLRYISDGAFMDTPITEIVIPSTVEDLGYGNSADSAPGEESAHGAFSGCRELKCVTILSNKIDRIPFDCFGSCEKLQSVNIPKSVKKIEGYAFGFSGLTSVVIPDGVTRIGGFAFVNTVSLCSVTFLGDAPTMESPFYCASFNGVAFYPKGNDTWENNDNDPLWQSGGLLAAVPYTVDSKGNIIPEAPSADEVDDAITLFASETYPAGTQYPNNYSYIINGNMLKVYGREAFAFELSDACFGYLPISEKRAVSYSALQLGDILYADSGVWVITEKTSSNVKLAGVQNGQVCYDIAMSKESVQSANAYRTRCGVSPYSGEVDPALSIKITGPGRVLTENEVYQRLISLQDQFPQGMPYSEKDHYHNNVTWYVQEAVTVSQYGHGCSAFSGYLSDTAFGDFSARYFDLGTFDYDDIMVGDRLFTANHEMVVLEVYTDCVVVAEGNYDHRIHWGRTISRQEIESEYTLVTRYPEGTMPGTRKTFSCQHKYMDCGRVIPSSGGDESYIVYTCNSCGYSYTGELTTADGSKLKTPTLSVANEASTGKIKLSWDAVDGAVKYQVYRSTDNKNWDLLKTTSKTTLTNTSAKAGTLYYYKVKAIAEKSAANSAFSDVQKRTCDLARPTLTVTNEDSTGKIKLSWDAVDGAVKYQVYRSTDNKNWDLLKTTSKTTLTNTSAKAGTLYYYKVKAIAEKSAANSAFSDVQKRTCDLARPTLTVTNEASTGKIKLSWDAVDGAVKYQVYRSTDNKNWDLLKTTSKTTLTNTSAKAGTLYYYKVKAIAEKSAANSAFSSVKKLTCDLERPTISVSKTSDGNVKVKWNAIEGAAKYYVYRKAEGESSYTKVKSTTSRSYTDKTAEKGIKYSYNVKAICSNTDGNSANSKAVSITIKKGK